jgi:hypothetical protein
VSLSAVIVKLGYLDRRPRRWFACVSAALLACALGCGSSHPDLDVDDGGNGRGAHAGDAATGRGVESDAAASAHADDGGDRSSDPDAAPGAAMSDAGEVKPSPGNSSGPLSIVANPLPGCEDVPPGQLPDELACTGLYSDIASKTLAEELRPFTPAQALWSDGASKQRWIYLPEGTQIDSSQPDAWTFPVGTKLFKEFSWDGHRVETRLFWKATATIWLKAAYHWDAAETKATRFAGGEVDVGGHTYYVPSPKECDQCHKGRTDRALGFEMISLGMAGAEGLTLAQLMKEKLLTDNPAHATFELGDDGTGKGAAALAWLHVNCGVSCHNGNSAAEGFASDLRLRLPSEAIDGGSSAEFDAIRTTVGVAAHTPKWMGKTRIVAGSPDGSLLYQLASTRDLANPKNQMPPIASRAVDPDGIQLIEGWIRSMPAVGP